MRDLHFTTELEWSPDGVGTIAGSDFTTQISVPAEMGGRGVGANPEELLVGAAASCFTANLIALLRRRGLPVSSVSVSATGTVTGPPGRARFKSIAVVPTILGGDPTRQSEYEIGAVLAHTRCLIANTLSSEVAYSVDAVYVHAEDQLPDNASRATSRGTAQIPASA